MSALCLIIINLNVQCTDNIQQKEMSSQTEIENTSVNKSHVDKC